MKREHILTVERGGGGPLIGITLRLSARGHSMKVAFKGDLLDLTRKLSAPSDRGAELRRKFTDDLSGLLATYVRDAQEAGATEKEDGSS